MVDYAPRLIAWEITRACTLRCKHCRAAAVPDRDPAELSFTEITAVLKDIAGSFKPIIILTGGEPMAREDVYDIAQTGTDLGLRMVMAPCGEMIDRAAISRMKQVGIQRISLSLDGAEAATHDDFRCVVGAYDMVINAAQIAKSEGLPFQINTTITKYNVEELPKILKLAKSLGAVAFHPFMLVPTGRGSSLVDQEISPERYEEVLRWVADQPKDPDFLFKPTCAPHYIRIMKTKRKTVDNNMSGSVGSNEKTHHRTKPAGHPGDLDSITRGCMGGVSFAFISYTGRVQMCGFLETAAGDLRANDLSFTKIWNDSEFFSELRSQERLGGKCGICEFRKTCGGCRARAYALSGDYMGEEPFCIYEPKKIKTIK